MSGRKTEKGRDRIVLPLPFLDETTRVRITDTGHRALAG